jgi:hypothetical protein
MTKIKIHDLALLGPAIRREALIFFGHRRAFFTEQKSLLVDVVGATTTLSPGEDELFVYKDRRG